VLSAFGKLKGEKEVPDRSQPARKEATQTAGEENSGKEPQTIENQVASPKAGRAAGGAKKASSDPSLVGSWWSVTNADVHISQSAISTENAPDGMITPIRSNGRPATLGATITCDSTESASKVAAMLVHQPADAALELMFELRYSDNDALIIPNVTSRANDWIMVKNPMGDNDKQVWRSSFNSNLLTLRYPSRSPSCTIQP